MSNNENHVLFLGPVDSTEDHSGITPALPFPPPYGQPIGEWIAAQKESEPVAWFKFDQNGSLKEVDEQ